MNVNRALIGLVSFGMFFASFTPARAQVQSTDTPDGHRQAVELLATGQKQYQAGKWQRARTVFKKAYAAAGAHTKLKAQVALAWSSLLWEQGNYDEADKRVADALERARELGIDAALGRLLVTRGHIEASQGHLQDAENTLKICIKLTAEQHDKVFGALCKLNYRLVRQLRGRPTGSEADYRSAIAQLEAAGTPMTVGVSLAKTAQLYIEAQQFDRALELLKRAQKRFHAAGSVPAQRRNRLRIAKLLQDRGHYGQARRYLAGLVAKFSAMNNRPALVDALILAAQDAEERAKNGRAEKYLRRSLATAKKTASPALIARSHLGMCEFGVATGRLDQVRSHCRTAAKKFEALGIPKLAARSHAHLAQWSHAHGKLNAASTLYSKVIQTLAHTGVAGTDDTPDIARYRANLCQVQMSLAANGAYHVCRKALAELDRQSAPDPTMVTSTYYAIGVTAGRDGWAGNGLAALNTAAKRALAASPPDRHLAANAMLRRGSILVKLGHRRDEAIHDFQKGIAITRKSDDDALRDTRGQLRTQLAQLQLNTDAWKSARQTLQAIIDDADGPADQRAWAYSGLARVELKLDNRAAAQRALSRGLPLAEEAGDTELSSNIEQNLKKFDQ